MNANRHSLLLSLCSLPPSHLLRSVLCDPLFPYTIQASPTPPSSFVSSLLPALHNTFSVTSFTYLSQHRSSTFSPTSSHPSNISTPKQTPKPAPIPPAPNGKANRRYFSMNVSLVPLHYSLFFFLITLAVTHSTSPISDVSCTNFTASKGPLI